MRIIHATPTGWATALEWLAPKKRERRRNLTGRARVHAILTEEQVLAIFRLRDKHGHTARRISTELGIPLSRVNGVVYSFNGLRTVLIK